MRHYNEFGPIVIILIASIEPLHVVFCHWPIKLWVKFIYSEKATKFCKISTVDLTVTTQDKSTLEISQNFVAFSEYMNFIAETETSKASHRFTEN